MSVDPQRFHDIFWADVPGARAALMAQTQRPLVTSGLEDVRHDAVTGASAARRVA